MRTFYEFTRENIIISEYDISKFKEDELINLISDNCTVLTYDNGLKKFKDYIKDKNKKFYEKYKVLFG